MGNWRTVQIDGTIDPSQVDAAHRACLYRWGSFDPKSELPHALSYSERPSLFGLHQWPATRMKVTGNCFERNYSVDAVADALRFVQKAAPSLRVKVHCGGDYETLQCVATITVTDQGVAVGPPEIDALTELTGDQLRDRFFDALTYRSAP